MITVKLIDREAIVHLVDGFEDFEKDKALKSGIRAGLNIIQRKGKINLKARMVGTGKGNLINAFSTRIKRRKIGGLTGFRRFNKYVQYGQAGNHAHLIDRGTKERSYITKSGKRHRTGKILGKACRFQLGFWTDAIHSEETSAINKVYEGVAKAVQRINNRQK